MTRATGVIGSAGGDGDGPWVDVATAADSGSGQIAMPRVSVTTSGRRLLARQIAGRTIARYGDELQAGGITRPVEAGEQGSMGVIQARAGAVRSSVIALSTPNHPFRLAGFFAASLAFFAIVGGAAYAGAYIVQDQRSARVSEVLGSEAVPKQSDLDLPDGVIAVQRVSTEEEFEALAGFKPFVPDSLPEQTENDLVLAVALPDDNGVRSGRIGYSRKISWRGGG
jgi:hypothetical protein